MNYYSSKKKISDVLNKSWEKRQICDSEEEGECEETVTNHLTEGTTSATEWMEVTTNSDNCSCR